MDLADWVYLLNKEDGGLGTAEMESVRVTTLGKSDPSEWAMCHFT